MCKILESQIDSYNKTTELMRLKGIRQDKVGYELIRKAIVFYCESPIIMYYTKRKKIDRRKVSHKRHRNQEKRIWVPYVIDSNFIESIKEGLLIQSNKDMKEKMQQIGRDPAMQWMIETLKASGYIQQKGISPEQQVKDFIEELSKQL